MDNRQAPLKPGCCSGADTRGKHIAETISSIISKHRTRKGALLPILTDIQQEVGCIPESAVVEVARALGIPEAKVYSTITFYTLYTTRCKGKNVIRVCESAPCHIEGAPAIVKALEKALGIRMGETTRDGQFTLEFSSCIGVCGVSPAIMINDSVYGNLTPEMIPQILAAHRATA